jgi:hypothetical protein
MDWSSANFGYDSTGAFNSTANKLTKNPLKGGGEGMAFPWMAAATLGSSIFSGITGGQAEAKRSQDAAAIAAMQANMAMQGAFRQNQQGLFNTTVAPEYQYEIQKRARNFENKFFKPEEMFLASEEQKRGFRDILSPEGREVSARERSNSIARATADRRAVTDAMFGSPAFASSRYTNPAWMQTA